MGLKLNGEECEVGQLWFNKSLNGDRIWARVKGYRQLNSGMWRILIHVEESDDSGILGYEAEVPPSTLRKWKLVNELENPDWEV